MKGPFSSYERAFEAATNGECVMARDARYTDAAWCVMDDLEATLHVNNPLSPWTHWENVRKES